MPDAVNRTVVVNTTPIIALALLDRLDILQALYGEVWIPQAVRDEITAGADRPGAAELARTPHIRVAALADPTPVRLLSDLDRGEAEVIALALEMGAGLVVIDERLARRHAERLGLRVTGVLGLLLAARRAGHVATLRPLLEALVAGGIRLHPDLIARTLILAGEARPSSSS